ncbi:NACHT, LRR and PYD domains-containing protein 9-like [Centropristis striata]|uniref:NACHT, LRR and PYD domains-containing protein 9-like n=1 Tax=Centropristis striata TaxID=184440 RepID=UPI0027E199E0|nr:NACHT, LRR and PYD domains-containing protein 9-like [Centropristis striata]
MGQSTTKLKDPKPQLNHRLRHLFRKKKKENPLENEETHGVQQPTRKQETRTKEAVENQTVRIKDDLDKLGKKKFGSFKFRLQTYGNDPIPLSELEDQDTKGIAKLLTNHYGPEEALTVTQDIFIKIKRRDLVPKVDRDMIFERDPEAIDTCQYPCAKSKV